MRGEVGSERWLVSSWELVCHAVYKRGGDFGSWPRAGLTMGKGSAGLVGK